MNDKNDKFAFSILVTNQPGVLTRIASLLSQRDFNVDTFTSGDIEDNEYARVTITASGDSRKKEQMLRQISKLYDVKKVEVGASGEKLREILDAASVFRSKVVDMSPGSVCIEITGETSKIDAFLNYIRPYGILEYCRTGLIAVQRGSKCLSDGVVKTA